MEVYTEIEEKFGLFFITARRFFVVAGLVSSLSFVFMFQSKQNELNFTREPTTVAEKRPRLQIKALRSNDKTSAYRDTQTMNQ